MRRFKKESQAREEDEVWQEYPWLRFGQLQVVAMRKKAAGLPHLPPPERLEAEKVLAGHGFNVRLLNYLVWQIRHNHDPEFTCL